MLVTSSNVSIQLYQNHLEKVLAAFGFFHLVTSAIDSSVKKRVSLEVSNQIGDVSDRLESVEAEVTHVYQSAATAEAEVTKIYQVAATVESAAQRAESAAEAAYAARRTGMFYEDIPFLGIYGEIYGETADWVIVVSSSNTLESAQEQARAATSAGYHTAIYRIGLFYFTTIRDFASFEEVVKALGEIRRDINPFAYIMNLTIRCTDIVLQDAGFYDCEITPWGFP